MDRSVEGTERRLRPPSLFLMLAEGRGLLEFNSSLLLSPLLMQAPKGDGHPVLALPGFLASDLSMAPMRRYLKQLGYDAHAWNMGRNFGGIASRRDALRDLLKRIHETSGRKVSIIGWSLGGVIARELAKLQPRHVDRVVTLGSPFSGDLRQNRAWRAYEFVAGHKVDAPPIDCDPCEKPPVPTTALWSRRDGVVSAHCACGAPGEADRTREVDCSHIGFVSEPAALHAIVDALR